MIFGAHGFANYADVCLPEGREYLESLLELRHDVSHCLLDEDGGRTMINAIVNDILRERDRVIVLESLREHVEAVGWANAVD